VLVNADNQVFAGHARLEAAKLLGLAEAPVLRVGHLSPAEQRAFVIADNRLAELAEWDREALAIELQGLMELDFAVEVTGFDMGEIELILHDEEEDEGGTEKTGANAANSRCGAAVSRCGDVWLLGAHQLSCGDAADEAGYAAVDAAIRRWQKSTGSSATLAGSGQTFKAIAQKRRKQVPPRRASKPAAVAPSSEAA
jgi:ParB-like chromosome segregation protein Spo0J